MFTPESQNTPTGAKETFRAGTEHIFALKCLFPNYKQQTIQGKMSQESHTELYRLLCPEWFVFWNVATYQGKQCSVPALKLYFAPVGVFCDSGLNTHQRFPFGAIYYSSQLTIFL